MDEANTSPHANDEGPVSLNEPRDRQTEPIDAEQPPRLSFPVVGIGASAGGLDAFTRFFKAMRPDSGMAFVLVQHLPPDRESMMADILSKRTKMPVAQVEDGLSVQPNHVYVIRPGYSLTIEEGAFHLGRQLETPRNNRPIDDFFRSLAEEQQERAICVVMSGMGSNGTAGCQAVKAVGGLCIAQDPMTAEYPSMPRHLMDAGYADYILNPEDIPDVLLAYAGHPYATDRQQSEALLRRDRGLLREVLSVLRTRTRQDFSGYKAPTLMRRVQRRMGLNRATKLTDYVRILRQSPSEVTALADDLLIHVTGFFRDAEAWEALRQRVIVPLVDGREPNGSIRCWVAACSSGEEAYTLAMLLVEEADRVGKPLDVKVFATDMAERSLQNARAGIYPGGIETELTPERLERFFHREDAVYRVRQDLRERVIFAPQNILQDPPFSRIDIASCRNLLIYLEPQTQERVLALLHFGLREGGTLFLGTSETIAGTEGLFEPVDKKARIFRRVGPTRHGAIDFRLPHGVGTQNPGPANLYGHAVPRPSLAQMTNKALLDHHTPAAVTVDRDFRIVYFHGDTGPYLDQPRGEATRNLLTMAREGVRGAARVALQRAIADNGRVTVPDGWVQPAPDRRVRVAVSAEPLDPKLAADLLLVSFDQREEIVPSTDAAGTAGGGETNQAMAEELRRVRDELQSTIEELQTSNEELKASNEEVTSVNEELQSTNEELETSKEEMQLLNKELMTVNAQLRAKMEDHRATADDLASLLTSTDMAVIFLDTQFRIRRFTPAVRKLQDLVETDVGRPLSDLARRFADPMLTADADAVLRTLVPVDREITSAAGNWFLRRVTPYRTADNRIDGVVISFVDITRGKKAEEARARKSEQMHLLSDITGIVFAASDPTDVITDMFRRLADVTEMTCFAYHRLDDEQGGRPVFRLATHHGLDDATAARLASLDPDKAVCGRLEERAEPVIIPSVQASRDPRTEAVRSAGVTAYACIPLSTPAGVYGTLSFMKCGGDRFDADEVSLLQTVCAQITIALKRKHAEQALRQSEERLERELRAMNSLHELTTRLATIADASNALAEILSAAVAMLGADMGSVQVLDPDTKGMKIVAQQGFSPAAVDLYMSEDPHTDSACTVSFHEGRRVVFDDVHREQVSLAYRKFTDIAGFRSVQSTPLMTTDGQTIGVLSTYFRQPRHLSDRDLRLTDLYVRLAGALIERLQAEEAARRSESRFMMMADVVPELLWENDATGRATWYNRAWLDFTGMTFEQSLGYGWLEAVYPDDRDEVLRRLRAAIDSGQPMRVENRLRRASDGAYRWFLAQTSPLRDASGKITQWFGAATDVHEQREAIAALQESEERFRLVVEGARDFAILMIDPHGRITTWNAGAEEVLGYTKEEAVGQPVSMIFTPEDRANGVHQKEMDRATETGAAADVRWHLRKDEVRFWSNGMLHALRGPNGELRGFVKVMRDETARKHTEDALQQSKEAAEQANRLKDEFLATLSHELRTPLAAILIWSKLLRSTSPEPETLAEGLEGIEQSAEAQRQLIDDLLDMSRITTGKLRMELRETDLGPLVEDAVTTIGPTAGAKGVEIRTGMSRDVGVVMADPDRLRQIVWNLLTNAVKFTPTGGIVTVGLWRQGDSVEIRVTDTGRGIDPDFLPHVFERFRQAEATSTRTFGGLGIGLAIVKQLVERHGGTIRVESEGLDRGATFTVLLPLPRVRTKAKSGRRRSGAPVKVNGDASAGPSALAGVRVLLVEDQDDTRKALTACLRQAGAAVRAVVSVQAAMAEIERERPDVLVSDIGLPGEDGNSLIRRLRAAEASRGNDADRIPAIALTAFARDADERQSLAAGFDQFISKPVDPEKVVGAIASMTTV